MRKDRGTEDGESLPDRSESVHPLGSGPRETFGLCDLLDVPRRHVNSEG